MPSLAKWNPSHTLCTAREIITLWVSRMVMFNLYFKNQLPFTDVFIHAMIQDGEGRKMSKSLNNGVDPLDIIESHGADAMRFTLAMMATNTQDVRMPVEKDLRTGKNTSPKFDLGRNFCNKLWNAARFAISSLSSVQDKPTAGPWAFADRWILSRLQSTIREIETALADYRFDMYAKSAYDFFWGDFCDWYIEMIKPAMRDPARAPQTAGVLANVLDASLRILHPIVPFITEALYQRLNEIRPTGGGGPYLIRAAWPKIDEKVINADAEKQFADLRDVVVEIRRIRNEYKIDTKKKVTASISAPAERIEFLRENQPIIELLAMCVIASIGENLKHPADATRGLAASCEIFVEGLVDKSAEAARFAKRCDELKKLIATLEGRLANESYTQKAPQHLVEQTKQQLADARAEAAKLGCT
jgi:valyl-tRNA synthetase